MAGDPRIRGEHEDKRYADWDRAGSSPHTRGARARTLCVRGPLGIIPAYAGSTRRRRPPASSSRDHPRIRGEHKAASVVPDSILGSSPHTRGAPGGDGRSVLSGGIIPAYAGSTRRRWTKCSIRRDHPRIRGEHPLTFICASHRDGSSPHTRGARLRLVTHPGRRIIIPAYAGSTVHPGRWSPAPADHPRIRGEHGDRRRVSLGRQVSSPHTRGARIHAAARRWPSDHPRIRGEHRQEGRRQGLVWGSSPHTRGARHPGEVCPKRPGIIPAYAGSTSRRPRRTDGRGDHPRIRGEHVDPLGAFVDLQDHSRIRGEHRQEGRRQGLVWGSSPHTRGARHPGEVCPKRPGIIPAYAGSTSRRPRRTDGRGDHPRIRGEHVDPLGAFVDLQDHSRIRGEHSGYRRLVSSPMGSSPHTRGAPDCGQARQFGDGIIPAYAGSTAARGESRTTRSDHPRIRGEHRHKGEGAAFRTGSSPHTRGAREPAGLVRRERRIIPAYAGSTKRAALKSGDLKDHPRIRGEHDVLDCRPPATSGSSPHTRGAPPRKHSTIATSRIIPAYAGSTRRCRWLSCPGRDHPRIRGEHNQEDPHPRRSRGSSPHTRGAPTSSHWPVTLSRIIPAYAGSTAPLVAGPLAPMGSSPHTRGARGAEGVDRAVGRIIPAYAGSTGSTAVSGSATWDHPRIRGEHSHPTSKGLSSQGSSPHTRGAPSTCRFWRRRSRIIPAYAGSTGSTCSAGRWLADHPRIRGEHRDCAPRARTRSADHPRIRGEHSGLVGGRAARWGSSPHTRGARIRGSG